jgi:glycosyltransferase involved in cell wall biosynthesis
MISVIIPTYKEPEALDLCLRSAIKGQKNKNQIIVVVDGFYDINKEVLDKYQENVTIAINALQERQHSLQFWVCLDEQPWTHKVGTLRNLMLSEKLIPLNQTLF